MLNDLANIPEGEKVDEILDPFGNYLVQRAKEVRTITQELIGSPDPTDEVIKQERYKAPVRQALAYFSAELKRKGKMIKEELGEEVDKEQFDADLLSQFNQQLGRADILLGKEETEDDYFL